MPTYLTPKIESFLSEKNSDTIAACLLIKDPSIDNYNEKNKAIAQKNMEEVEAELKKLKINYSRVNRAKMFFVELNYQNLLKLKNNKLIYSIENSKKDFAYKP